MSPPAPPKALLHGRHGLYRCTGTQAMAAEAEAAAARHFCATLETGEADASRLRHGFAAALRFPAWFGDNWDALADCLNDLSWIDASGYLIILRGTAKLHLQQPQVHATLLDILSEAAEAWREAGTPFWVLLEDSAAKLPTLPAA